MLAAVQKAYATHVRMEPRYPLFLPLVVDITDPAQANYSLPGLFLLPNFPKGILDAPTCWLPRNIVADCPIIILETYCGEKRDCLSYKSGNTGLMEHFHGPGQRIASFPEDNQMAPATRFLSETDLIKKEKT
jgi:hypothetical protein